MSLADIVKTLGGDLCGPCRAVIPGPGHSPDDRSVSLLVDRSGRLVVESFGRSDWREVLDDLRARNFIDRENRITGAGSGEGYTQPERTQTEKLAAAVRLWDRGRPIDGTLSERYVRSRSIQRALPADDALRHLDAVAVRAYDDEAPCYPAMLAGIRAPDGRLTAVEITYLDRQGRRHPRLKVPRKIIGVWAEGSAVRLDPAGERLVVGEGVFTALSASERFDRPTWALLSTSRLKSWRPPEGLRSLLIAADNGRGGRWAAQTLQSAVADTVVEVATVFPRPAFDDFNTEAQSAAAARASPRSTPCS